MRRASASAASLLLQLALRVEIADAAALAAGGRIERRIDQRGLSAVHRGVDGAFEFVWARRIDADAAEGLHHLVVARALHKHGRRRVIAHRVDVGAAVDAVIVEDDDADRQLVAADRLDIHAGKAECRVALDAEHRLAGLDGGGDGVDWKSTRLTSVTLIFSVCRLLL